MAIQPMIDAPGRIGPTPGALIAAGRLRAGLSQAGLAQRLCEAAGTPTVSRNEVSRWERGVRLPSGYWQRPLVSALRLDQTTFDRALCRARAQAPALRIAGSWLLRTVDIDRCPGRQQAAGGNQSAG
jgi:transcriptional regulator with XRE-family HTH domain